MVEPRILQGTWEEIKRHDSELVGRRLTVILDPEESVHHETAPMAEGVNMQTRSKQLVGFGILAHLPGSSEAFALEKQREIDREDGRVD